MWWFISAPIWILAAIIFCGGLYGLARNSPQSQHEAETMFFLIAMPASSFAAYIAARIVGLV